MRTTLALAVLFLFSAVNAVAADEPPGGFYQVSRGIYRGPRPGLRGLKTLANRGVKVIINVENDDDEIEAEAELAKKLGLTHLSFPMSAGQTPNDEDITKMLNLIEDTGNHPVYVHCKHGRDRTGLVIGLYRVFKENWSPEAAYKEMLKRGFRPKHMKLTRYFEQKTGYDTGER